MLIQYLVTQSNVNDNIGHTMTYRKCLHIISFVTPSKNTTNIGAIKCETENYYHILNILFLVNFYYAQCLSVMFKES